MFSFYTLTPGRRIYALRRVRELAQAKQLETIVAATEQGLDQDRKALELDAQRLDPIGPTQIRHKDLAVDRILVAIDYLLGYEAGKPNGEAATRMQTLLFPAGVTHHTRLPFPEQSSANDRVLSILESAKHAQLVDMLRLGGLTKDLRLARDDFEAALQSRESFNPTTWDEVKAARTVGQELYLQVVVQILAQFPDDPDTRDELLAPIWQQEDAVRAFRRQRRGPLLDVNPESGDLVEVNDDQAEQPEPPPVDADDDE